jgi:integration host factor subunit alpha
MTKADLVERIHQNTGFPLKYSNELLEALLEVMKCTLESGDELKIAGFGKFEVRQKNDRKGRNPQSGEAITIGSRRVLTFKPSALLKQSINGGGQ